MLLNCGNLKVADFCKGVVFALFLAPTYVNIITIFAVANIHDVSWGSRPAGGDGAKLAMAASVEKKKEVMYKDFRSNFLIIWLIVNMATGYVITWLARRSQEYVIFILGIILAFVVLVKLLFTCLFGLKSLLEH